MPPKAANKSRVKEKKAKLKEEGERLKALGQLVKAAYAEPDLLASVEPFRKYEKNGLNLRFEVLPISKVSQDLFQWLFNLLKNNMQHFYENAWGWSDSGKRGELREDDALYLIAYSVAEKKEDEKPVAFAHFRFEYDQEKRTNVLYLYEIQLEEAVRGKGLGKHMMQILELLAFKYKMDWLMLTVFKENTSAMHFYIDKLKYTIDEVSPSIANKTDEESYEILSKCFKRN